MNALHTLINYYNETTSQTVYYDVAKSILNNLSSIRSSTIYDWAELCNVSTATISRFAQKMGYKNFSELRSELETAISNFTILDQLAPINQIGNFNSPFEAYSTLLVRHISKFFEEYDEAVLDDIVSFMNEFNTIRIYTHGVDVNQLVLQSSLFMDGKAVRTIRFEADQLTDVDKLSEDTLVILIKPNVYEKTLTLDILQKLKEKNIPILLFTNSKLSVYLPFASKFYAFNGYMTQLDDPIFFLLMTLITIKYREKYMVSNQK